MLATPHRAPSHWCGTFLSSACPYHDEGRRYSCHLAHAAQAAHNASPYAKCLPIERLCRRCKHGSTVRLCTGNATDLSTHRRRHRRVLDARQSNSDLCRRALSMSYDCYCVTLERRLQLPLTAVGDSLSEQLFDTFRCHLCPEALSICTGPCLGVEALACVALNRSEGCEGSAPNRPRFKRRRGWDLRST